MASIVSLILLVLLLLQTQAQVPPPNHSMSADTLDILQPQATPCGSLGVCSINCSVVQELCNLEPFIEENLNGITPCKTCFFPAYPRINDIKLDAYKPMDFSNQWVYFHGDSTLRQVYGEFYSIIHKTQVPLALPVHC